MLEYYCVDGLCDEQIQARLAEEREHEGEPVRYEGQNLKNAYHWTRNQNPNAHFITIRPLHYSRLVYPTVETQQYRIHHPDMLIYNTKAIYLLRKWVSLHRLNSISGK